MFGAKNGFVVVVVVAVVVVVGGGGRGGGRSGIRQTNDVSLTTYHSTYQLISFKYIFHCNFAPWKIRTPKWRFGRRFSVLMW